MDTANPARPPGLHHAHHPETPTTRSTPAREDQLNALLADSGLTALADPVITDTGQRVAGMRFTDPRVQALLATLCMFRLLPRGFTNRDLRHHLEPLLGRDPAAITTGQATYDLRRLRHHGFIERVPHSHRYRVTDTGHRQALFLNRTHNRLLRDGLAHLAAAPAPNPPKIRAASRTYETAIDDLLTHAGLAA